ncbi:MAG: carboxypeptidase regulatory-like domain-containing protein [Acidobacteriales bacterium]|nr:carboxypeptidase regulatory-like domain-containing protein [Terriglobales bacterium]
MANVTRAFPIVVIFLLLGSAGTAQEPKIANVRFQVLKEYNGKPIRNASVILHPVNKSGKQKRGGQQLKTDEEGRCAYPGVPFGKIRVQVIAPNFQTFGEDFDIRDPEQEIVIKLKRPQEQHTIYDKPKS